MPPSREAADGLTNWAVDRAPQLLARAEAEAVTHLRDVLIEAALKGRTRRPYAPPPVAPEQPSQTRLLWAYCILRASDPPPSGLTAVDPSGTVERIELGGLAALVSSVPESQFSVEALQRNLNDVDWLTRIARAHEAVLERTLAVSTLVPLRLCTIYEHSDSVRRMLELKHDALVETLERLAGRQEWSVKVLVDREKLLAQASARCGHAPEADSDRGAGSSYMLRRRLERQVRDAAASLAARVADQVHARLQDWAIDAVTRPAQNPELSGHIGDMLLNGAYLVEAERTGELRHLVRELEAHHSDLGARIELTGPWPPYSFVARDDGRGAQ